MTFSVAKVRSGLMIVAAVAQVLAGAAPQALGWPHDISSRSGELGTAIVPAGWAFSIWGPIFLGSLAFAIYGAWRGLASPLVQRLGWLPFALFALAACWELYVPLRSLDWISWLVLLAQFGIGVRLVYVLDAARPLSILETIVVRAPLTVYAGWIAAAMCVSLPSTLRFHGLEMPPEGLLGLSLGMIALAAVGAAWVAWAAGGCLYAAPVVWALAAVIAANQGAGGVETIAFAAGVGAAILAATSAARLIRRAA